MTRAIYVPLGINVYTFCFSEPLICILIAQTTLFTPLHDNNLVFCLHLFNPFAKQTTQYCVTNKMVLSTDTVMNNITKYRVVYRFLKNDHCDIVRFRIAYTFIKGQFTP